MPKYVRRCDRCQDEMKPFEQQRCDACKFADNKRVYVSNDLSRPWHVLGDHWPYDTETETPETFATSCGTHLRSYAALPDWPKRITGLTELARRFPAALVCRQCSDRSDEQADQGTTERIAGSVDRR